MLSIMTGHLNFTRVFQGCITSNIKIESITKKTNVFVSKAIKIFIITFGGQLFLGQDILIPQIRN